MKGLKLHYTVPKTSPSARLQENPRKDAPDLQEVVRRIHQNERGPGEYHKQSVIGNRVEKPLKMPNAVLELRKIKDRAKVFGTNSSEE